jgi:plastocyanin
VLKRSLVVGCVMSAVASAGCFDIGYDIRPPAPSDAGRREAPDGCAEGVTDVRNATTTLNFSAMDVDQHLVRIRTGDVIAWVNGSTQVHTVSAGAPGAEVPASDGGFDSGRIPASGGTWAFQFCRAREIEWFCKTHPAQMRGYRIIVQ